MFYWNPEAAEKQFFFNDRDIETGKVFCVLYDIEQGRRVKEYRFEDTPFGNGGVAQNGGHFLGINYARMARLRPVTGYAGAYDWTGDEKHPRGLLLLLRKLSNPSSASISVLLMRSATGSRTA